jgi:beta-N-acetylhexosaminidase
MKRILLSLCASGIILVVAFFAYQSQKGWHGPATPQPAQTAESTDALVASPTPTPDPILEKVASMTLDEKIGQLMIIGFEHPYVDAHIKKMITQYHIGGINLLGRNITGEAQTKKLMADLQALSSTTLFLATDQEGGTVTRFKFLKELTPQSKITDREMARRVAEARGKELMNLGVNMNFAPVLDYVTDPTSYLYTRTFATTSESIAEMGEEMVEGYTATGVVSVAKHFPGYGNIKPDPHKNTATVNISAEELEKFLYSFKYGIEHGAEAIMTAHIIIPSVDSKPATLSSKFLTDMLRDDMHFEGVIITDDLEMVSAGTSTERLAVASIKAGADMIISTYTTTKHVLIFNALKKAVETGEIPLERLDASVERILRLKAVL